MPEPKPAASAVVRRIRHRKTALRGSHPCQRGAARRGFRAGALQRPAGRTGGLAAAGAGRQPAAQRRRPAAAARAGAAVPGAALVARARASAHEPARAPHLGQHHRRPAPACARRPLLAPAAGPGRLSAADGAAAARAPGRCAGAGGSGARTPWLPRPAQEQPGADRHLPRPCLAGKPVGTGTRDCPACRDEWRPPDTGGRRAPARTLDRRGAAARRRTTASGRGGGGRSRRRHGHERLRRARHAWTLAAQHRAARRRRTGQAARRPAQGAAVPGRTLCRTDLAAAAGAAGARQPLAPDLFVPPHAGHAIQTLPGRHPRAQGQGTAGLGPPPTHHRSGLARGLHRPQPLREELSPRGRAKPARIQAQRLRSPGRQRRVA